MSLGGEAALSLRAESLRLRGRRITQGGREKTRRVVDSGRRFFCFFSAFIVRCLFES
jgi:hypothetical protein